MNLLLRFSVPTLFVPLLTLPLAAQANLVSGERGTETVTVSRPGNSKYVPAASLKGVNVTPALAQFFGSAPALTAGSTTPVTVTIPSAATLTGISVLTLGIPNKDFTDAGGGTLYVAFRGVRMVSRFGGKAVGT